jgi:GTPase Era involved in 16S rRNA processing
VQVPSRSIASMLLVRRAGPLKAITSEAIRTLERLWSVKVHLYLHIAIKGELKRAGGQGQATASTQGGSVLAY